jgi:hypothetical protein
MSGLAWDGPTLARFHEIALVQEIQGFRDQSQAIGNRN